MGCSWHSQVIDIRLVAAQIFGLCEPFCGFRQAALEALATAIAGLPTEELLGLGISGPQALNLGVFRTQAGFVRNDFDLDVHDVSNQLSRIADGNLEITAEVDHFSETR